MNLPVDEVLIFGCINKLRMSLCLICLFELRWEYLFVHLSDQATIGRSLFYIIKIDKWPFLLNMKKEAVQNVQIRNKYLIK